MIILVENRVHFFAPYTSIPWGSAGPDPYDNLAARVLYDLDHHNNLANVKNATSSVPSPWKFTKIVGGWGFAPDPTGELTALPQTPSWIKGESSKGKGRERRGEKGRGGVRREGAGLWTLTMLETDWRRCVISTMFGTINRALVRSCGRMRRKIKRLKQRPSSPQEFDIILRQH